MSKARKSIIASGLVGAAVLAFPSAALAHHPEVEAEAGCSEGQPVVEVTASSWVTQSASHRLNSNVAISLDGSVVGSGAFTVGNGFTFTLTVPAAVGSHVVRATAVAGFGPGGVFGSAGSFRETEVEVTDGCVPPPTTVTTTTQLPCFNNAQVKVPGCDYTVPTTSMPRCEVGETNCSPTPPCPYNGLINYDDPACVPVVVDTPHVESASPPAASPPLELAFTGTALAVKAGLGAGLLALGYSLVQIGRKKGMTK